MRNLKRALSLALAAVMVLGLMIVGAGAADVYEDFTDKDEIQNTEAVATMVSLGVIAGKEDGSYFDPTGTVTRGEMAKIVAVSLNGGEEPVLGNSTNLPKFSDVPTTHWAYNYIAYCVQQGIIAGRGDGTFAPDEPVTGSAAAKMFLCALGYRADLEGLTGVEWEINTNILANQDAGLYDGLSGINASDGLSRDNTAQMAYNAVQAQEVTYNNLQGDYSGVLQTEGIGTMLERRFGVVKVEGVVIGNETYTIDGNPQKAGKTLLDLRNTTSYGDTTDEVRFNVTTTADMLGQEVVIYVKPTSKLSPNPADDMVLGNAILTNRNEVVTTDAGYGTDKTLLDFAKSNDLNESVDSDGDPDVVYSYNYGAAGGVSSSYDGAGRGIVTTLVDNDGDGRYEYAFVLETSFGEVTSKTTKDDGSIRISGLAATDYTSKNTIGFDDVEREDYVNYVEIGDYLYVYKAETVTGSMTQYDNDKKSYITVDGEKYGTSQISNVSTGAVNTVETAASFSKSGNLNKDAVFYLDTCGNIVAVGDVEASSQYAFVTEVDSGKNDNLDTVHKAKAALSADGETYVKEVYAVDDGENGIEDDEKGAAAEKNTLYAYTVNGDDQFTFTKVALDSGDEKSGVAVKIAKGETTITIDDEKYFADENTAYFYVAPKGTYTVASNTIKNMTVDSVSAYTGYANAPSFDSSLIEADAYDGKTDCMLVLDDETGLVSAIVVVTESAGLSSNLMYLYDYVGTNENGVVFNVIMDDEIVENVTITSGATQSDEGMVAAYTETTNGYSVTELSDSAVVRGNIEVKAENSIVVNNQEYKLTSDSVIANIDGDDTTVTDVALVKGDYVTVAFDTDKSIKGVYVTVPYAANNAEIHSIAYDAGATDEGKLTAVADKDATVSACADAWTLTYKTSLTGNQLKAALTVSSGATVKVYETYTGDPLTLGGEITTGSATTQGTVYIEVTSQDGSTANIYEVTLQAAV